MAVNAYEVRTSLLEAQERDGVVTRVVMQSRVTGLTDTDHQTLLSALAAAGIPAYGTALTGTGNESLILVERNTKLIQKGTVDVTLVYEHITDSFIEFGSSVVGFTPTESSSNVQQVRTNRDIDGNTVTVEHTWPATDPDKPGKTDTQGGEWDVFAPSPRFVVKGIKTTTRPWLISKAIAGKVNDGEWSGGVARTWMCTAANWSIYDKNLNRYQFTFEFQYNEETWDPVVVFIDSRTGKPAPDLVENTGYKLVTAHYSVNFEAVLGVRLQGG